MTDFAGKRTLITGAASGLGRILAERLAARGANLILWDRDEAGLESLATALAGPERRISTWTLDLRDPAAIRQAADQVEAAHGGIDILVNNAGVVSGKSLLEATEDEILRTLEVNTLAPIRTTHAFLPGMIERNSGHIVNISSAAGIVGSARLADYCASKFALFGFDEALRVDLRRAGAKVRTTIVCPYYIATGMFGGVETRFPWLLPILDPHKVVDRLLAAVRRNRRRLVMPWFIYASWPLRILPVGVFDALLDFFGVTRSMDHFTGRAA